MKTKIKTIVVLSISILFSSLTYAAPTKKIEPIAKHKVAFNLSQFCNYLENGNPNQIEGVYASPDNRYKIAIVKNDEKHHDFIGIVISADNIYWEAGEVKFNFVMKDQALTGYYYNTSGEEFPLRFEIDADSLKTNFLQKVDVNVAKTYLIATL